MTSSVAIVFLFRLIAFTAKISRSRFWWKVWEKISRNSGFIQNWLPWWWSKEDIGFWMVLSSYWENAINESASTMVTFGALSAFTKPLMPFKNTHARYRILNFYLTRNFTLIRWLVFFITLFSVRNQTPLFLTCVDKLIPKRQKHVLLLN